MAATARSPEGNEPLKVLVAGVGHLGKNHARVYTELKGVVLEGVVDSDPARAREIGEKLGLSRERVRQLEARAIEKLDERVRPPPTNAIIMQKIATGSELKNATL